MRPNAMEAARGNWRGILLSSGIPEQFLQSKHGPCPLCAGKDRYRWDNKEGRGTYYCAQCGAGDGMDLFMKFHNLTFDAAAAEVERIIGSVRILSTVPRATQEQDAGRLMERLLSYCKPVRRGDVVDRYLTARNVNEFQYPEDILTCERCWYSDGIYYPAMVAKIRDASGTVVNLHRTFLGEGRKADVPDPRRLMPGTLPEGAAIRLGPINGVMGIAEGVETALAAGHRYGCPVWSALNANILVKWRPPAGVEEVLICGDNDASWTGQAAACELAKRLHAFGLLVRVKIPSRPDTDWADETFRRPA